MRDTILFGDCRETLKEFDEQARMCVTSPPYYGLRDYGGDRVNTNVPEYLKFQENERVIFEWGVGGDDKMNSSSWILNEFLKR